MSGTYNLFLVAISILAAVVASYAALDLANRVTSTAGAARRTWLAGGAAVMGIGIWSMHFLGMIAFEMPMPVSYDVPITLLSMVFAIVASGVALFIVSRQTMASPQLLAGGGFMATGILGMHYIGMEGMQMQATIRYDSLLVGLSAVIAFSASLAALWMAYRLRRDSGGYWLPVLKAGSATVMGAAISGMHYTGMAAADFLPASGEAPSAQDALLDSPLLATTVAATTFVVLGIAIFTVILNRRFKIQESALEESEEINRAVIETAPNAIIIMSSDGLILRFNYQAERMFGYAADEAVGQPLKTLMPERFREPHEKGFRRYMETGEAHVMGSTVELAGLRRNGEEFPLELSIGEVHHGESRSFVGILHDITDRKQAEDELREAEGRFRSAFDNTLVGMALVDLEGQYFQVNNALSQILGCSEEELLDSTYKGLTYPEDAEISRSYERQIQDGEVESYQLDKRYVHAEGYPVWVSLSVSLVKDQEGEPLHYIAQMQDISGRVEAEKRLSESEQRYASLSEHNPDGVFTVDLEANLLTLNPAMLEITGYSREELLETNLTPLIDQRDCGRLTGYFEKAARGEPQNFEASILCKDDRRVEVGATLVPAFVQGDLVGIHGIIEDISDRVEAERALRESEERFRGLSTATSEGIVIASEGKILEANNSFATMFGYESSEVAGRTVLDFVAPESRNLVERKISIESEEPYEVVGMTKEGVAFDIEIRGRHSTYRGESVRLAAVRDITERKRAEEANARLASIVESSQDAILGKDLEGIITTWNSGAERLYGYTVEEAVGNPVSMLVPPDHPNEVPEILERIKAGETVDALETKRVTKDGTVLDIALTSSPIVDSDGEVMGTSTIARNITERKRDEEEIQRQADLLELTQDSVIVSNPEALISFWNEAAEKMYGWSREEAIGANSHELLETEFPEPLEEIKDKLIRNGRWEGEVVNYRRDGSPVEVSARWSLQRADGGDPEKVLEINSDITERKRATEELAESESRFRTLFDQTAIGVCVADLDRRLIETNAAYQEITGYSAEELVGMSTLELTHPEDLGYETSTGRSLLDGGHDSYKREKRYVRKDDEVVWTSAASSLIRDENGQPRFIMGVVEDITERKRTASELQSAKEEAEAANRAKSEFLANMSHEIRTPMNSVIGMSDLLMNTNLNDEQREYVETVRNSGETLLTLINDVLDFSKIEAEKVELENIIFDLRTSVEDTAVLLAERAQNKGLEIASLVDYDVPATLKGDPGRLRQVLTNLLGNAIKFTEEGEVVLKAELSEETDEEALVRFEIRDTGIGLDEDQREHLFESFSQADASTTRRYGGTGLGLAISERLVGLMGGGIQVDSAPGEGSTFYFTARFEKLASGVEAAPRPRADLRGLKALVVDDNATNRAVLHQQVTPWGMEVEEARDGAGALEKLRSAATDGEPYDLALLDMQMPEMDGLDLACAIKEDPDISQTRLVLITSMGQRGDGEEARRAGVEAYLTKPVRQAQLYDTLSMVMGVPEEESPHEERPLVTTHTLEEAKARTRPRVLLAEDNEVNQRVAVRTLENLGYRVDLSDDGEEAVEAVSRTDYAAVVMDVQMPKMDGYEATAEIRRRENEEDTEKHTPIIAMTANALQGDREKALEAGMDDYISKPVRAEELGEVLRRWIPEKPTEEDDADTNHGNDAGALDPDVLADLEGLEEDGEEGIVAELADMFLEDAPSRMGTLRKAVDEESANDVRECAHSLKGSSGNIGACDMRDVCEELEKIGGSGDLTNAPALLEKLEAEFDRVKPELNAIAEEN